MSQIVKTFMGIFLILFMSATSFGILSAYMEVLNAQDMQARIVDELENSDFAAPVIRSCYEKADGAGYRLGITLYYEEGGILNIDSLSAVPWNTVGAEMARVELSFPFRVSFLGIDTEHTFCGYAR